MAAGRRRRRRRNGSGVAAVVVVVDVVVEVVVFLRSWLSQCCRGGGGRRRLSLLRLRLLSSLIDVWLADRRLYGRLLSFVCRPMGENGLRSSSGSRGGLSLAGGRAGAGCLTLIGAQVQVHGCRRRRVAPTVFKILFVLEGEADRVVDRLRVLELAAGRLRGGCSRRHGGQLRRSGRDSVVVKLFVGPRLTSHAALQLRLLVGVEQVLLWV